MVNPPESTADSSSSANPGGGNVDAQTLAHSLVPLLRETCEDRLSNVVWFRADWQRGGAATGRAQYASDDAPSSGVIVKIPVGNAELQWTRRLQNKRPDQIVPRLFACGETLGGYDIGWIVIEELPCGPLGAQWSQSHIPRIARAAARFHDATRDVPLDRRPREENWSNLLREARENARQSAIPDEQRWSRAIKSLQARLNTVVDLWSSRPIDGWIHGDLHPANAMCRSTDPSADVVLIDLAEVRPGHWIEDAVYLERLLWSRPDDIRNYKPVKLIAAERKSLGLWVGDDAQALASARRALLSATAPRFLRTEGNPAHLAACLNRLESSLNELKSLGITRR